MEVELRQGNSSNVHHLQLGDLHLVFSYQTVVAFTHPDTGWVISENVWSRTTGKHLNQETPRGVERYANDVFETWLKRMIDGIDRPHRGDEVEAWIKGWRDAVPDYLNADIDAMLDDYRLHADTGIPLDQEVETS